MATSISSDSESPHPNPNRPPPSAQERYQPPNLIGIDKIIRRHNIDTTQSLRHPLARKAMEWWYNLSLYNGQELLPESSYAREEFKLSEMIIDSNDDDDQPFWPYPRPPTPPLPSPPPPQRQRQRRRRRQHRRKSKQWPSERR